MADIMSTDDVMSRAALLQFVKADIPAAAVTSGFWSPAANTRPLNSSDDDEDGDADDGVAHTSAGELLGTS